MPKGQTIISWTADNEAKLLLAILSVHDIKVNHAAVAAVFGPDIPGSCIQTKMSAIRKKAAKMGLTATPTPVTTNRRAAACTSKGQSKVAKNGNLIKEEKEDDQEGNMQATTSTDDDTEPLCSLDNMTVKTEYDILNPATKTTISSATNKVIVGRVTKKRASPRKVSKTDYTHLVDPFASMNADTDGDGEKVFGDDPISSEDSAAEDGEFKGGEVEGDVAMEA